MDGVQKTPTNAEMHVSKIESTQEHSEVILREVGNGYYYILIYLEET